MSKRKLAQLGLSLCLFLGISSCSVETSGPTGGDEGVAAIRIDGSSTVLPISSAVAEAFQQSHPNVDIRVNKSGTGPGFEKFSRGETEINDASRPIKEAEAQRLQEAEIGFVELSVAIDGLSVVVNKENDWATALTIDQLTSIWEKGGSIQKWSDLDASWPDEQIKLFGPDSESGTYDYFREVTVGKGELRTDYQESVDDNVLAYNIAEEKYALGYFGFAYLNANQDKLKGVAIAPRGADAAAAVAPSAETIENGTYRPLSRPLFIYVRTDALNRPEVHEFVDFYLSDEGQELVKVKYVPLSADQLTESRSRLSQAATAPASH